MRIIGVFFFGKMQVETHHVIKHVGFQAVQHGDWL